MSYSIGLTGGIGSGKSTVATYFGKLGATIIDADEISHAIIKPGTYGYESVVEHFGPSILTANKEINRAALRKIIFGQASERKWLESQLHPVIRAAMKERLAKANSVYSVLVIPLLAESGAKNYDYLDRICVVTADLAVRLERVMQRDDLTREEVTAILQTQAPEAERLKLADDIIENNGNLDTLRVNVANLNERYLKLAST